MHVYFTDKATRTINAKLAELQGRGAQITAQAVAVQIEEGNTRDRLAGKDRYGKPLAKLRSPRRGVYAGKTGPVLAPDGAKSRVITNFHAKARRRGGRWGAVGGWTDVISAAGVPFLGFHFAGVGRLPVRDLAGISPGTWAKINPVINAWKARVAKVRS